MHAMRLVRFSIALLSLCAACDDATAPRIIDLEGPHGLAETPGPWPVAVLARGGTPAVMWATDDGDFTPLELRVDGDRHVGRLPDQPAGTTLRYFARVEDDVEPEQPRTARVVDPAPPPDMEPAPGRCALAFRRPRQGDVLTFDDDAAPQAGLQLTVVVSTNLADGVPARLRVGGVGYAGSAGAGVVAFEGVSLRDGEQTLEVDAVAAGGEPCGAVVIVRAEARP